MEIKELEKHAEEVYWNKNKKLSAEEISFKKNLIVEEILKLLEWDFKLVIWWIYDEKPEKIFNFLRNKQRTCRLVLDNSLMYSVEAPKMDRDFFKKYLKELFFPENYGYTFEDSKKVMEIFEGGIKIKNK